METNSNIIVFIAVIKPPVTNYTLLCDSDVLYQVASLAVTVLMYYHHAERDCMALQL